MDTETSKKVQELQILEQNIQNFLMQKQVIQVELNEIINALEELKKSKDEAYKIISGIMIKSSPADLTKDLEEKKKLLDLRISSIEKQESILDKRSSDLKKEITDEMSKEEKKKTK